MEAVPGEKMNPRAFAAIMAGLSGLTLPLTGLALHHHTHHPGAQGYHGLFHAHVFLGVLFVVFSVWHLVLNRRSLIRYFRDAAGASRTSREFRLAAAIVGGILLVSLLLAV
jgi:hypothetical protein